MAYDLSDQYAFTAFFENGPLYINGHSVTSSTAQNEPFYYETSTNTWNFGYGYNLTADPNWVVELGNVGVPDSLIFLLQEARSGKIDTTFGVAPDQNIIDTAAGSSTDWRTAATNTEIYKSDQIVNGTKDASGRVTGNGLVANLAANGIALASLPIGVQLALKDLAYNFGPQVGPASKATGGRAPLIGPTLLNDIKAASNDYAQSAYELAFHTGTGAAGPAKRFLADSVRMLGLTTVKVNSDGSLSSVFGTSIDQNEVQAFLKSISDSYGETSGKLTKDYGKNFLKTLDNYTEKNGYYVAYGNATNVDNTPVSFQAPTLKIVKPEIYKGDVSGFKPGTTLDLSGIGTATKATLGPNNVLTITKPDGSTLNIKLNSAADYTGKTFNVSSDGNGGSNITIGSRQLAFVLDTTGSMDPYISAVQAGATQILNAEFNGYSSAQVAVVSFKDPQAGDPDAVLQSFTNDKTAVQNAINSLTAGGGDDTPEGDYSGLLLALNGSAGKWDLGPNTSREIILYTDAPVKDTDLAAQVNQYAHDLNSAVATMTASPLPSGAGTRETFTFAPIAAAATTPAPVTIDTIQVSNDPTATASVQKIALDNGGVFLQSPSADQLTNAIVAAIGGATLHFSISDQTTGQLTQDNGQPYDGPVGGIDWQYINIATDNLNITASAPNSFIKSGSGKDAIDVSQIGGDNVLDGSTGSNFLVGGTGNDTFFVDDRGPTADVWSTLKGFHSGDYATIWGITPSGFNIQQSDNQGALGATGLTFSITAPGKPNANLTLAGFSTADVSSGKLSISFGHTQDLPSLPGSEYMLIHGT